MEKRIEWKRVSPADLSLACSADYFAFIKSGRIVLVNELDTTCVFTKIILTSASLNYSLYEIDIWLGYQVKGPLSLASTDFSQGITEELIQTLRQHSTEFTFDNRLTIIHCA